MATYIDVENNFIDLSNIKINSSRNCKDWFGSIGAKLPFHYNGIDGEFELINVNTSTVDLKLDNKIYKGVNKRSVTNCAFGNVFKKMTKSNNQFQSEISKINENILFIDEYVGNNERYNFKCKKCNHIFKRGASKEVIKKISCKACDDLEVCNNDYHNSLYVLRPDLRKYFDDEFEMLNLTLKSHKKVLLKCDVCHNSRNMYLNDVLNKGFSCQFCGDNIPFTEKMGFKVISELSKVYDIKKIEREFSRDWTNGRFYDIAFEFENNKYFLEMDGSFHFKHNQMSNQTCHESQEIDEMKNKIAKDNGYSVIRINCDYENGNRFNHIKENIESSELSEIFDLTLLDWNNIYEFSINSFVRKCCEIKRINPNLTTKEIADILDNAIDRSTVSSYLKIGNDLGLCRYNPKNEVYHRTSIGNIFAYKNGELVNKEPFESAGDVARRSLDILGVQISRTSILRALKGVALGEQSDSCKGFTFVVKKIEMGELL